MLPFYFHPSACMALYHMYDTLLGWYILVICICPDN